MPTDNESVYRKPIAPEIATQLAAMEAEAKAPKKVRKPKVKRARKAAPKRAPLPSPHDAHVAKARPFLIIWKALLALGHNVPLSYVTSADPRLIHHECQCTRCQMRAQHSTT